MKTISFREKETGWATFFTYYPEMMFRVGNVFITAKNGEIWEHNDKQNPITNTFYGVRFPSSMVTIFNDVANEDKIFKTFIIEGNSPWQVSLKTNLTETTLKPEEFNQRESRFFTYLRGNENEDDFSGAVQGIGVVKSINNNQVGFDLVSDSVDIGDKLYLMNGETPEFIGIIRNKDNTSITLDSSVSSSSIGKIALAKKSSRIDGGEIRGYFAEVELTNNEGKQVELFAINSNIIKSYV
ncbi:hypothetical protein [Flavobacterium sp. HSC-61S13]|uniref:hypothetical protein n=1 Tax=Flavobacterium sp. HSC-61S13 TaxID=2910963 RepID=UPI00209F6385|nr:hypothetical protein [Flavobacterium sp. HSC-61S13]MCP1996650.1 hypothetical protein [Flavobacterium sp. HSC-61S13]